MYNGTFYGYIAAIVLLAKVMIGVCCYAACQRRKTDGFSLLPQGSFFDDDDEKDTELFRTPLKGNIFPII